MYLTEGAIDDSVSAVGALSAPGSLLAMTYFERRRIRQQRAASRIVALAGEPFRFGWEPSELPAWLDARGFELLRDDTFGKIADRLLPARWAMRIRQRDVHLAVARRR
jgi:O-methyltransferase involved in polyketide biosynthesis